MLCGKLGKTEHALVGIGHRWEHDAPKPSRDLPTVELRKEIEHAPKLGARKAALVFPIFKFYVKKDVIGHVKQLPDLGGKRKASARIKRAVNSLLPQKMKKLTCEFRLHERLSARERNAPLRAEIPFESAKPLGESACLDFFPCMGIPGIGIMAERASKRTAREEDDGANTRAVNRSEALDRVNSADHTVVWKVRLMTSLCCSRESLQKCTA